VSYGNLLQLLQGGSGGATGGGLGGGGGGGIEIGALGSITIGGTGILANGGAGAAGLIGAANGSGGGSGGGILIHGNMVTLTSILSAQGGAGGSGQRTGDGGGGGGGRVAIVTGPGGFVGDLSSINVAGGPPGMSAPPGQPNAFSGGVGQITIITPEPTSLVLLSLGLIGVLGYAHQARRRMAA
jgi:hypothetical protein